DKVIRTSLDGFYNMTKPILKKMVRQKRGAVVSIASLSGLTGNRGQANYSASKAGLIGLTKSTARELASRRITVNAIAPGFIETEMTGVLPDKVKERMLAAIPLGRIGCAKDVAAAVLFLASEQAAYITGQVLGVDGGMAM
ncbi:MAG TPA: SDR family oxidoreductase, partial [Lachnospiraceae bacterium]|nr:SDR family oxidoreductase [Lachnospiraceae bacterium]